jgi:hypothetical protein
MTNAEIAVGNGLQPFLQAAGVGNIFLFAGHLEMARDKFKKTLWSSRFSGG